MRERFTAFRRMMGSREPLHGCVDCEVESLLKAVIFLGLSRSKTRNAQIFQVRTNAIIFRYKAIKNINNT